MATQFVQEPEQDITPYTELIYALGAQNLTWHDALAELIDNSFDASASYVWIVFRGHDLRVQDDGVGIERTGQLLTMGKHIGRAATRLGRFGIGFKDAAFWLSRQVQIDTTFRARRERRVCWLNWEELVKRQVWKIPGDQLYRETDTQGTRLTFPNLLHNRPPIRQLAEALGFTYASALRKGRRIIIDTGKGKATDCLPYELPPLEHVVEDIFDINGKHVYLRAGIVQEGHPNPHGAFIFSYDYRVLFEAPLGVPPEGGAARVAGIVELDRSWPLSKNKNALTGNAKDELHKALLVRCADLFRSARAQQHSIRLADLENRVSDQLKAILKGAVTVKEKRDLGQTHGTHEPGDGTRKRNANKIQPGEASKLLKRLSQSGIRFELVDMGEPKLLGKADCEYYRVQLNRDHPTIAYYERTGNDFELVQRALLLFADDCANKQQPLFRDMTEFLSMLGTMLAELDMPDISTSKLAG